MGWGLGLRAPDDEEAAVAGDVERCLIDLKYRQIIQLSISSITHSGIKTYF